MDSDLFSFTGCSVSRLRHFVSDFYSSHVSAVQNVDDTYFKFIWSIVAQHPSVTVGTTSNPAQGLYFPPQPRKKGHKSDGDEEAEPVAQLERIEDGRKRSLVDIVNDYGDAVRIAVDPDTCFVVITGSHARVSHYSLVLKVISNVCASEVDEAHAAAVCDIATDSPPTRTRNKRA